MEFWQLSIQIPECEVQNPIKIQIEIQNEYWPCFLGVYRIFLRHCLIWRTLSSTGPWERTLKTQFWVFWCLGCQPHSCWSQLLTWDFSLETSDRERSLWLEFLFLMLVVLRHLAARDRVEWRGPAGSTSRRVPQCGFGLHHLELLELNLTATLWIPLMSSHSALIKLSFYCLQPGILIFPRYVITEEIAGPLFPLRTCPLNRKTPLQSWIYWHFIWFWGN